MLDELGEFLPSSTTKSHERLRATDLLPVPFLRSWKPAHDLGTVFAHTLVGNEPLDTLEAVENDVLPPGTRELLEASLVRLPTLLVHRHVGRAADPVDLRSTASAYDPIQGRKGTHLVEDMALRLNALRKQSLREAGGVLRALRDVADDGRDWAPYAGEVAFPGVVPGARARVDQWWEEVEWNRMGR